MIQSLNLRNGHASDGLPDDMWENAVLVTTRHAVRRRWNEAALRKHCQRTGQRLYRSHAYDTMGGQPLPLRHRFMLAEQLARKRKQNATVKKHLEEVVELAVGMKVLITLNLQTDIDLANGARGEIVDIILHPDEPDFDADAREVDLKYPPVCVLVKFERTKATQLTGLGEGVLPITPVRLNETLNVEGRNAKVQRLQMPICAAYAFTDFRAQGQTIRPVLVDLSKPPSGRMTPFNAYVACSRAAGRDWIRFIREVDWRQFSTHPCEYLRAEDARLERLDAATKRRWEAHLLE